MKRLIMIVAVYLVLSAFAEKIWAQGYALRFNTVLLVSSLDTVPAGKIWKIESVMHSSDLNAIGTSLAWSAVSSAIKVNGNTVYINRNTSGSARIYYSSYVDPNATSDMNLTALPIWLPAGTTLAAFTNINYISVVEFNLVTP
ncbi:MAG: hypothetical protein WCM76_13350 [Bacteroidota bacterium]